MISNKHHTFGFKQLSMFIIASFVIFGASCQPLVENKMLIIDRMPKRLNAKDIKQLEACGFTIDSVYYHLDLEVINIRANNATLKLENFVFKGRVNSGTGTDFVFDYIWIYLDRKTGEKLVKKFGGPHRYKLKDGKTLHINYEKKLSLLNTTTFDTLRIIKFD